MRRGKWFLLVWGILSGMAATASAATVTSTTHPAFYQSFDAGAGAFIPYQRPGGVASGVQLQSEHGILQLTNTHAGSFGVDTKLDAFDALKYGDVVFDYKLTPDVKVNFFFHINGNYYGVIFSGPDEVRPGTVLLGKLPDVIPDGKWHRAHIPLRQWLQRTQPLATALKVDEVIIGNWDNSGWLMAGIGGNGPGAVWWMDNFTVAATGPQQAEFTLTDSEGKAVPLTQKYFWALDGGPLSPINTPSLSLGVTSGFHLLQISDSEKQPVANYGFYAAAEPPQVGAVAWHNNEITIPLSAPAGINSSQIALKIDATDIDFKNPALQWNKATTAIVLNAADAGLYWKDGQTVNVQLSGVQDFLGQKAPPLKSTFTVDYTKFTAMPPAPTLKNSHMAGAGGFETSLEGWQGDGKGDAILERDTSTAASGFASLRLTNPANAAPFTAWVTRQPFDASLFPFLEFDYRVPPQLRVDLLMNVNGQNYAIDFTDHTPRYPRLGKIEDVKADLQWHHASVPLLKLLQQQLPTADRYEVKSVAFGDTGWTGNTQGMQYWIDNFHFVPVLNGNDFKDNAQLRDITGIQALSWKLSAARDTEVPRAAQNPGSALSLRGNGLQWLHLRAQDGAGNWSAPAQIPVALDAQTPVLAAPDIATNTRSAPTQVQWPLRDNLSLDLSSLHLTALGKQYDISNQALTYDVKNGKLTWDLLQAIRNGDLLPFKNGQTVDWELQPAQDAAGNKSAPLKSTFVFDYALQKSLPKITLESSSHPRLFYNDYNGPGGSWGQSSPARVDKVIRDEKTKDHALKVANLSKDKTYSAGIYSEKWDPHKYNLLGFDYKIKPGSNAAFTFRTQKRTITLVLCGDKIKGNATIPGIIADDKWHTAVVNLLSFPGKLFQDAIFSASIRFDGSTAPTKTELQIDNVLIQGGSTNTVALRWKAIDLSGITGYRFNWDQNSDTTPSQTKADDHVTVTGKPGVWYAHLQAQNGAGLWSNVTHYPILIP